MKRNIIPSIAIILSLAACALSLLALMATVGAGAFGGSTTDEAMEHRGYIMFYLALIQSGLSIIGLSGAILAKKNRRLSGQLIILSVIGVIFSTFSYDFIPWMLVPEIPLLIIGVLFLVRSMSLKEQQPDMKNTLFFLCLIMVLVITLALHKSL